MKYWSISVLADNPFMPPAYAQEFRDFCYTSQMSPEAFAAGFEVAQATPPRDMPNLAVVHQLNAPDRRLFLRYPSFHEWAALERGGIFDTGNHLFAMFDALH